MSKSDTDERSLCNNDMLLLSLGKFYSTKENMAMLVDIIDGSFTVSLRLIDWFVTNFSKKNNTVMVKNMNNDVVHLNVHLSYRSQLKAYSKQQFDPFRRRDRMNFHYDRDKFIETTIGQLNFFRWVIQNDILQYIEAHSKEIEDDMVVTQRENQKKRMCNDNMKIKVVQNENGNTTLQARKKRNELSKSLMKNMNVMSGALTLKFD